jgi:hypothetical protein
MKKITSKKLLARMIGMVLVFVVVLVGCKNNNLIGTWEGTAGDDDFFSIP